MWDWAVFRKGGGEFSRDDAREGGSGVGGSWEGTTGGEGRVPSRRHLLISSKSFSRLSDPLTPRVYRSHSEDADDSCFPSMLWREALAAHRGYPCSRNHSLTWSTAQSPRKFRGGWGKVSDTEGCELPGISGILCGVASTASILHRKRLSVMDDANTTRPPRQPRDTCTRVVFYIVSVSFICLYFVILFEFQLTPFSSCGE